MSRLVVAFKNFWDKLRLSDPTLNRLVKALLDRLSLSDPESPKGTKKLGLKGRSNRSGDQSSPKFQPGADMRGSAEFNPLFFRRTDTEDLELWCPECPSEASERETELPEGILSFRDLEDRWLMSPIEVLTTLEVNAIAFYTDYPRNRWSSIDEYAPVAQGRIEPFYLIQLRLSDIQEFERDNSEFLDWYKGRKRALKSKYIDLNRLEIFARFLHFVFRKGLEHDRRQELAGLTQPREAIPWSDLAESGPNEALDSLQTESQELDSLLPSPGSGREPVVPRPVPESAVERCRQTREKKFPRSQRDYWRARAVAEVLKWENPMTQIADIIGNREFLEFGCENRGDHYGPALLRRWLEHDPKPKQNHQDKDLPYNWEEGLYDPKPPMTESQRHAERCRAIAALLAARDELLKIVTIRNRHEFRVIACENRQPAYELQFFRKHVGEFCMDKKRGPLSGKARTGRTHRT